MEPPVGFALESHCRSVTRPKGRYPLRRPRVTHTFHFVLRRRDGAAWGQVSGSVNPPTVYVTWLEVHAPFRGRGAGRFLLAHACAHARHHHGATRVELDDMTDRLRCDRNLYRTLGLRYVGPPPEPEMAGSVRTVLRHGCGRFGRSREIVVCRPPPTPRPGTGVATTRSPPPPAMYICYVLVSDCARRTYCGITNNPARRIRQHNGEIRGGAKYTRGRHWTYAFRVAGFRDKREALSFEWHLKHQTRRRRRGRTALARREAARDALLALPRWAHLRRGDADDSFRSPDTNTKGGCTSTTGPVNPSPSTSAATSPGHSPQPPPDSGPSASAPSPSALPS